MTFPRWFFPGRARRQGERFLIVPGPWRISVWRRSKHFSTWHGIRQTVLRVDRPGPSRSRRRAFGPFRIVWGCPSLGRIVEAQDGREHERLRR